MVPKGRPITLPENAPSGIVMLGLCQPMTGVLDCGGDGECNDWYRVDVMQPGEMRVHLELGESEGPGRLTRLLVRPIGKPILAQQISNQGEPLEIVVSVAPDVYGVLVQGGGARRTYELLVSVAPPGAPEAPGCPDAEVAPQVPGDD
jgi:hypothetical protein